MALRRLRGRAVRQEWIGESNVSGKRDHFEVVQVRSREFVPDSGCVGVSRGPVHLGMGNHPQGKPASDRQDGNRLLRSRPRRQRVRARQERERGGNPPQARRRGDEVPPGRPRHRLPDRPRGRREALLRVGLPAGGPAHPDPRPAGRRQAGGRGRRPQAVGRLTPRAGNEHHSPTVLEPVILQTLRQED